MFEAWFINRKDNVPYKRHYKNYRTFRAAYNRINAKAKFVKAIDWEQTRIVMPSDLFA